MTNEKEKKNKECNKRKHVCDICLFNKDNVKRRTESEDKEQK